MPVPVNDLGYRSWNGKLGSASLRWLTIAAVGIRIVFKSQWIKRIMFVAWFPTLLVGGLFFFYEQYVENRDRFDTVTDSQTGEGDPAGSTRWSPDGDSVTDGIEGYSQVVTILQFFAPPGEVNHLVDAFSKEPDAARGEVWSFILLQMLRRTQGFAVLLLIGLIAPPLISRDIRSRAFLFYFSKPITRLDYLLGKFSVVGFYVGFVTILPALALYLFGVLLSPSLSVVLTTWDLPFRVITACLVAIVPSCLLGLMISSLTSESRFAGFAWFMIWILGYVGYQMVYRIALFQSEMQPGEFETIWRVVSLYDCLSYLQSWVMGLENNHGYALTLLTFVAGLSVFCVLVIQRRISAPLRA